MIQRRYPTRIMYLNEIELLSVDEKLFHADWALVHTVWIIFIPI